MASVTLRRLSKTFDRTSPPALQDLTLDVRDGEFLVLLGPSGCGKTTVLRCIAGLDDPTDGQILIGERDVTHVAPAQRDVAMVFQSHGLYPHLSVRENIAFALEMRRVPQAQITRRVLAAAERLGLRALLARRPAQLSGGQRQRVALGRAIVREPQVFLFDEPLANLDTTLRTELRGELLKLHRELAATMIYVTHDQVEAMTMGQRIAVLHEGRLRQLGTPTEVYERPADVFVARFVGHPGMNVLQGRGGGDGGAGVGGGATRQRERTRAVECGSLVLPVALPQYDGEVQLGVRPEHVALCPPDQGMGNAEVLVVEPLGSETLVHLDAGGQPLVAKVPGIPRVAAGDRLGVQPDLARLHFFDGNGSRLA
jgi:multiple sugar transport system ATP-binding protein